jgi:stress response protein YsnF
MSRTVTALYDTRAEAEAAKQRLSSAVDVESARIIDKDNSGSSDQQQGSSLGGLGISDEDRHAYGEGINRGGFLLCAEVDSDEDADEIVRVLEQTSSVDLDDRQNSWKSEGWAPYSGATGFGGGSDTGSTRTESTTQEERIPIVEEHLNVGKRQVERGGARVRSYVRETPVHEQVNLREEHVSVERRPVDQTLGRGELDRNSDMLQERTIEMTETSEVPVVEKEARVTEEMVIRKTAEERTEEVEDTVRRTEVDVDETTGEKRDSAFGFGGGSSESGSESRTDFQRTETDRDR